MQHRNWFLAFGALGLFADRAEYARRTTAVKRDEIHRRSTF